ncbi:disulfide isomerase DsbC N-terminal domain-containing protein [Herbaspirillum aquaticum]|uniref:disulfide isomerase DsbC N-terminal domain-containing protein n=1 Tax=Herbaspirillum aquaticum TaxID=568783 RepID=UPI0032C407CD
MTLAMTAVFSMPVLAGVEGTTAAVAEKFKAMYPKTTFREIRKSQVAGLYEVVMGDNIAYTDDSGRYFIFGHLFDMQQQVDLTAQSKLESQRVEWPGQYLGQAIKTVRGDGSRGLVVFSDPDCPYKPVRPPSSTSTQVSAASQQSESGSGLFVLRQMDILARARQQSFLADRI